ncbi:hypothetical protein PHMEG_0004788 [Phytophthora megakarya]|uniref:DDE Tnp4 domain-containing protein n=1 Tax=Phytophthora megakarya TaxID=4795 RepID=A0A225WSZ4_9STRA|nr:hypothetical protein PHMEG_0004788 [Phytophthora megakarya]
MRYEYARLVRIRHHLNVACLPRPDVAPWMYIWYFGTDENFLNTTSLCRRSFRQLLDRFSLYYELQNYKPKGGRPRKLQHHHQVLGVLLAFYVGSMGSKDLCMKFGVPGSTLSRVLNEAESAMQRALTGFGPARIVWPTLARQKALARLTALREPMLPFTWGFIDGKNFRVQQPSNSVFCDTSVLLFLVLGFGISLCLNAPLFFSGFTSFLQFYSPASFSCFGFFTAVLFSFGSVSTLNFETFIALRPASSFFSFGTTVAILLKEEK